MKKEGKQAGEETDISATTAKTQTNNQQSEDKFIILNGDVYPNRLIGHLKNKIQVPQQQDKKCKGSGCMILDGYFLTSAHNLISGVNQIKRCDNLKIPYKDSSFVKLGLKKEKQKSLPNYIAKFSIEEYLLNPSYQKQVVLTQEMKSYIKNLAKQKYKNMGDKPEDQQKRIEKTERQLLQEINDMQDFAILKVKPDAQQLKEQYMPVVVISQQTFQKKKIAKISVYGFAVDFNKSNCPKEEQSSVYINNLCGNSSNWKTFERNCITYDIKTEQGTSGAPITAQLNGKWIIIGIHKGKKVVDQNKTVNVGVGSGQMIEPLNEIGYQKLRRPFVFTQKTMHLHDQNHEIAAREILFLMDKGFGPMDMLVYTAYDLNKVQKILLSGNEIGDLGVQYLLRRKYSNLHALFLTQNKIGNLSKIKQENWKNVDSLTVLGLSVNELKDIPKGFLHLKKLEKLWLNHNQIKDISPTIIQLCKEINRESFTVYLHSNNINLANQQKAIQQLKQLKTRTVLQKQGVNA